MTAQVQAITDPPWMARLRSKLGEREVPGADDNPWIVEVLTLAGLPPEMRHDAVAWCGSAVNWAMRQCGISGPKGPAAARHWLGWGVPIAAPVRGCVVVFWRGSPSASTGHVALYEGTMGDSLMVLGGNQGTRVCVAPYPRSRVLGYRWPSGVALPG